MEPNLCFSLTNTVLIIDNVTCLEQDFCFLSLRLKLQNVVLRDLKPQCFWIILRHSFFVLGKLRQMFKKVLLSIDGGKKI